MNTDKKWVRENREFTKKLVTKGKQSRGADDTVVTTWRMNVISLTVTEL